MKSKPLYFDQHFKFTLLWREQFPLRIGGVLPINKQQISDSLKHLSHESIRNRFMGSKKEFSSQELEYLTQLDGWDHFALGIEETQAPQKGVAIARLVRSQQRPQEAEIAITIIDQYQNLGLGTLLMRLIVLAASERKIERLNFTFLPQNEGIVKLIRKIGSPHIGSSAMDYVQYYLELEELDLHLIKSQLAPHLPGIDTFDS